MGSYEQETWLGRCAPLPPVQTSSWVFTVQYSEFSLVLLIIFAISTSLAAAS
jgi:hypothetical protein